MENKKEEFKRISKDNRETIVNWVKALRSGGYEQGTGNLYRQGRFCCLGVLIDSNFNNKKLLSKLEKESESFIYLLTNTIEDSIDPHKFFSTVGFLPEEVQEFLARLNDFQVSPDFYLKSFDERSDILFRRIEVFLEEDTLEKLKKFCIVRLKTKRRMSFSEIAEVIEIMFNLK